MKQLMVFFLAFVAVLTMLYAGFDALSRSQERSGLFLTFVGMMTIIGLLIDVVKHIKARRTM